MKDGSSGSLCAGLGYPLKEDETGLELILKGAGDSTPTNPIPGFSRSRVMRAPRLLCKD